MLLAMVIAGFGFAKFIRQKISEKSDVNSFGVVLLELITGREIFDEHLVDIVNWAKPFMFKGDSVEINYSCLVDSALKGDYIKSEMELMIYCAAVSVYRPSKRRPRMKQIVEALEGKMPSNELWVAKGLKEITEASNLHWSKATSSQGIEPEIMQIQEMHAKSHYSALEQAATLSETSLEATAHNAASPEQELEHIMVNVLKFSYLRLPDDTTRMLEKCALFFENEKIARKSLIDNWISDDLTDTYQKGRNVLETLVTAGLLESPRMVSSSRYMR
ncbi:hypothetical protein GH714_024083 [Hevea brasiliensis]|uniref:non-specific serine/threonine protein kinase n=1 Tax=Hevea brasiliensis TaxID=3981 RepID=A0A6A6N7F7_HEVBR|nr:hypothetical protein GH714_024083 [Hevea brasiliensis]